MNKYARYVEILLGLFFLASAAMKAVNVDGFGVAISAYGVIKDPTLVRIAAYITLALESLIGGAFLAGWRYKKLSAIVATGLTVVFSGLILYAWKVNGLEDCGCFGDYIKMSPPQSLAKNAVLIAIIVGNAYALRNAVGTFFEPGVLPRVIGIAAIGGVGALTIMNSLNDSGGAPIPVVTDESKDIAFQLQFGDETVDLSVGEHLVVFLNTDCEHCRASVPGLNALDADESLPPLTALMKGDDDKLDDFLLETEATFRMELLNDLVWMTFLPSAPPVLYYVKDGMFEKTWQWVDDPPSPESVAGDVTPTP